MKPVFENAIEFGKVLKRNTFQTEKGLYHIFLISHNEKIFFIKLKNHKIVECRQLN